MQVQTACTLVHHWPDDIVKVWPRAVAYHNKAPNKNKAKDYMISLEEATKSMFKINDKKALDIIQGYEVYWGQLESDFQNNGGKQPTSSSPSTKILMILMTMCQNVKTQ